ncbi:hypothetical protein D9758_016270 [Tetrapyrgos nigripes]|uniref:Amine oxidase n=1 Tax=Tetrapyrgos nigripes TaxID=182062 RepID=A0A8H5C7K6_9AGAR|nr:hypothetical protein D9758_016270 [Tetrapyrgos nigripes]
MPNDVPTTAPASGIQPPLTKPTLPCPSHPLDPLTPDETTAVTLSIRHHVASNPDLGVKALRFITCYLVPPPKRAVLEVLGIGEEKNAKVEIVRRAEADFLDIVTGNNYNVYCSLSSSPNGPTWTVDTLTLLPSGVQPQISVEELIAAERIVKNSPKVIELAAEVGVKPDQIFCDGWSIGFDERFPQARRIQQALVFARWGENENLYAHPMDFIPIIDANVEQVLHIDFPPRWYRSSQPKSAHPLDNLTLSTSTTGLLPPLPDSLDEVTSEKACKGISGRERIPPPMRRYDFLDDELKEHADENEKPYKPRTDLKPIQILQPDGVSFKLDGHVLEWQGWKMHVAFSHREGIVLSTITYKDYITEQVRPLFYRLSLVEMVVPYASPEFPHPRKFAFDSGEYGMGTMANELSLGCDCVGKIAYLPGTYTSHSGAPVVIKNAICIHEEDSGVLWKHSDYRFFGQGDRETAGGKTVRRRRLVVSMVCTLANYEYIWNYLFYQDGTIEIECRLTGILQVYVAAPDEPNVFGTTVAPGVNAQNHQHLFSFRLDPMIDGLNNALIESDVWPLDDYLEAHPPSNSNSTNSSPGQHSLTPNEINHFSNAFLSIDTPISVPSPRPYSLPHDRRWRIVNPSKKHYASGKSVGYGLGVKGSVGPVFVKRGKEGKEGKGEGWVMKRAGFIEYPCWVVKEKEGESVVSSVDNEGEGEREVKKVKGEGSQRMWPAGKYVPQTRENPEDSIGRWVVDKDDDKDGEKEKLDTEKGEDILVFLTIGTTHIPRPEDWPVMPAETLHIHLKPQHFFDMNPAMDVPGTRDLMSKDAFSTHGSDGVNGTNGTNANGACGCN